MAGGGAQAQAAVAEQMAQALHSTSNLLHLMEESSPAQAHLAKLPKKLLAKASLAKNTGQVLHQLPHVVSSLDAYMEASFQSASQIKTVAQLLSNMENNQLRSILPASRLEKAEKNTENKLRVE
ncbi:tobamovirus multiplication protein 2B-like [Oryza brachyantha]|uniref:Tobamovirus multiplication protein 2B n=1 Tax=Oryza brachyantha TaxID=4533 RepID=J3LBR3_ORYBR|nr:tobamovirus multiplication protein 2B-like [Oryza brachyantha]